MLKCINIYSIYNSVAFFPCDKFLQAFHQDFSALLLWRGGLAGVGRGGGGGLAAAVGGQVEGLHRQARPVRHLDLQHAEITMFSVLKKNSVARLPWPWVKFRL